MAKRTVLYLCCLCIDLVAWTVFLLGRLIFGGALHLRHGVLLWISEKDLPRFAGITLGHAIAIDKPFENDERLLRHELFHVEQLEGTALVGAVLAAFFAFVGLRWSLLVFGFLPWIHYYGCSAAAWLRGKAPYRGNSLEEGARGVDGQ